MRGMIRQDDLNAHLGVDSEQVIVVDGMMLPGPSSGGTGKSLCEVMGKFGLDETIRTILFSQHQTFMDVCLGNVSLSSDASSFDVSLPVPTEIVVMTLNGPDGAEMVICPQSGSREKIGPGAYTLPMFDIEYRLAGVNDGVGFELLCDSMDLLRLQFETELLFDLLSKSVRSQRNRIDAPLSSGAISEAMELIERESRIVSNCALNTRAFSMWREHILSADGKLFGATALCCSPRKRQNMKRNYFLGPPNMLGVFATTTPSARFDGDVLTLSMRMGAVVLDRSLISSVDGPQ